MGYLDRFKKWMHLHIGKLSPIALKHRGAILVLSVLTFFIEPDVIIKFGTASVVGLGVTVTPEQSINIGYLLLALLIYRLIAFWASVLLENGTDENRAAQKALVLHSMPYQQKEPEVTMSDVLDNESEGTLYKWKVRQVLWEFVLPNIIAFTAIIVWLIAIAKR